MELLKVFRPALDRAGRQGIPELFGPCHERISSSESRISRIECPLGGRDTGHPRVFFHSLADGPSQRLENGFNDVMSVLAVVTDNVEIHEGVAGDGLPELFSKGRIEIAQDFSRHV